MNIIRTRAKTTYTVTGKWPFPLDMLRYDQAEPATPEDTALIERLSTEYVECAEDLRKLQTVTLVSEQSAFFRGSMSARRWESFGWKSSAADNAWAPAPKIVKPKDGFLQVGEVIEWSETTGSVRLDTSLPVGTPLFAKFPSAT